MDLRRRQSSEEPVILPRAGEASQPQHLLLAMLGDYWFPQENPLPSAALVDALSAFGVRETTARQAMRRLAMKGQLVRFREGRKTGYGFPHRSAHAIEVRPQYVVGFGTMIAPWDGNFVVVVFSVPEEKRELRRDLRTALSSYGFGNLHDAVWISPHDRRGVVAALLEELGVEASSVFYGTVSGARDPQTLVSMAFDTANLRKEYEDFIAEFAYLTQELGAVENALVTRTRVVNRWLTLRTMDPNLPLEVLPVDWPRSRAYDIFRTLYDGLGPQAGRDFYDLILRHDTELAARVAYFTSDILEPSGEGWINVAASVA